MSTPPEDTDVEFHAITLTADADGTIQFGSHTIWVGWHDIERRIELRQSRIVGARFRLGWELIGVPYVFVMTEDDLQLFLLIGGHGLVERAIAERIFGDWLKPRPAYPRGELGFTNGSAMGRALRRVPTPKLRMQVLMRDGRRCRICGRKPDDNVDLVLHVHHIRPWAIGGPTDPSNLITLCHTCHDGLHPHFEPRLFEYLGDSASVDAYLQAFHSGVANYRRSGLLDPLPPARKPRHRR